MSTIIRLWNKNFAILWQGQLISDFGNAAFSIMLGFWVLDETGGNVSLMGLIMACFALPAVILGPFAGAIADRLNRKWIIIAADFIRGILFLAMGVMLLWKIFPFWAIYPLAILSGASGAFFSPAMSSAIPDIVPKESLSKANSARGFSMTLSQLLGNSLGGLLYSILRAPLMVLFNGISFLYASVSQIFIKIPVNKKEIQKSHIVHDMAGGIKYAFANKGIRTMLLTTMLINFFAIIGISLMTPLFNNTPGFGVEKYGFVMGAMMAGAITGMLALSAIKIKPHQRSKVFGISLMVMICAAVPMGVLGNVYWMYPLAFIIGATNSLVNVTIQTIMQTTVPADSRGKVFGIMGTMTGGLQPVAMAISGAIASIVGIRPAITAAFSILIFAALPLLFNRHFREFINTDVKEQEAENTADENASEENLTAMLPSEN